jgi:hypothetical protein
MFHCFASVVTKENIIFNKRGEKDLREKLRNSGTAPEVALWIREPRCVLRFAVRVASD